MDRVTTTLIDLAEAAYNFESCDSEWLPGILASGRPLLDHGLGVAGGIFARSRDGRTTVLRELHLIAVPERCARRLPRIAAGIPHDGAQSGICMTLSEAVGETHALTCGGWVSHGGFARDVLGLWATDALGAGVCIMAPLFEPTKLSMSTRRRWQAVGTHVSAGFRLRRALNAATDSSASVRVRSSIRKRFPRDASERRGPGRPDSRPVRPRRCGGRHSTLARRRRRPVLDGRLVRVRVPAFHVGGFQSRWHA